MKLELLKNENEKLFQTKFQKAQKPSFSVLLFSFNWDS